MEESIIRIGVLGGASIAEKYMIPAIQQMPEKFKLVGVASRTRVNASRFADKFNTKGITGYLKMIDLEDIDAVYIPLPNVLHYEWVKKALESGLHVLVEKSLACSYSEVDELSRLARSYNLALIENFQFRFHSQLQEIRSILNSGIMGELRCIRSSFGFPPFRDEDNIRYSKKLGGGALLDAGAYTLKASQLFLGLDCRITAASCFMDKEKGVDIWGGGFVQDNSSDLFSEIAFGFDQHYQCSIDLWGSKGKLSTNRIFTAPPGYEPILKIENQNGIKELTLEPDHHFCKMLNHFYEQCLKGGSEEEAQLNLNQARLIKEFKTIANINEKK
ncbi:Gfo/Idh/MocA family protein [Rhodohalobacter sp. 8-1]|uniref:Gfo/Idh/MocA family protein n=1 Tax=Rhodohalobacter sp. 8-1 TaxID=3131972 RepID=UPI0030EF3B0A